MPTIIVAEFWVDQPSPQRCSRTSFCIAKVHRDARAIAIPASVFFGGSRGPIPADEANGNHATLQSGCWHFVVVEIEERLVGVDQRDVLPSVAIIVQDREAPAVRRIIQPREGGDIHKGAAAAVGEVTVAFAAVEGMDQYFVSLPLDPGEPRVNLRTEVIGGGVRFHSGEKRKLGRERFSSARTMVRQRLLSRSKSEASSLGAV